MRLCGAGTALFELSPFPAGIAPSLLPGLGTPALAPGIDWPTVASFVVEPVTGPVVDGTAVDPLADEPLCAIAKVLDNASAVATASVVILIRRSLCLLHDLQTAQIN